MFTLHKSLYAKSSQFAFTCHFLVTDLNNEDSPVSVPTSLLPVEYLATELFSLQPTFNSQLNWIAISSQPPLQSSTELTTLN
jgi:hypothetical protein